MKNQHRVIESLHSLDCLFWAEKNRKINFRSRLKEAGEHSQYPLGSKVSNQRRELRRSVGTRHLLMNCLTVSSGDNCPTDVRLCSNVITCLLPDRNHVKHWKSASSVFKISFNQKFSIFKAWDRLASENTSPSWIMDVWRLPLKPW